MERSSAQAQLAEIEAATLIIDEARSRASDAARNLRAAGASDRLTDALEETAQELDAVARRLRQRTRSAGLDWA